MFRQPSRLVTVRPDGFARHGTGSSR
jgi:hypothetical protein